jgi:hypothetical protein
MQSRFAFLGRNPRPASPNGGVAQLVRATVS